MLNAVLTTLLKSCCQMSDQFSRKIRKQSKDSDFSNIFFFEFKFLIGTHRKYFRQLWQIFLAQSLNSFRARSKSIHGVMFFPEQNFSSKWSSGDVKSSFDNPAQAISSKDWKKVRKSLKMNLKKKQVQKRNYIKMFLWTCWIQFWQLCWSLVVKCPITFCARSENSQKFLFFQTKLFFN